jgi:hypothetical protein
VSPSDELEDYDRGVRMGCLVGVVLSMFAALLFYAVRRGLS